MTLVIRISFLIILFVSSQAASISNSNLVERIQNLLTAPEETGLRLKRSTEGNWDRELDLDNIGVVFKIKYNDPANPITEGFHARIKFPGRRFFNKVNFDDVDLNIEFSGLEDGLFVMKVDYKFVEKFTLLADKPHEGSFEIQRIFGESMWKTKFAVVDNNKPFFAISFESDYQTKVHGDFIFKEDEWEFTLEKTRPHIVTAKFEHNDIQYRATLTLDKANKMIRFEVNSPSGDFNLDIKPNPGQRFGIEVTGDVYGPVEAKYTVQKDFTKSDLVIKHNNKVLVAVKLAGQAKYVIPSNTNYKIPYMVNYKVIYNVQDDPSNQGQAKIKWVWDLSNKELKIKIVPNIGDSYDYSLKVDTTMPHFKYDSDLKINDDSVENCIGEIKWRSDEDEFQLEWEESFSQNDKSPFYTMNNDLWFFGREVQNGNGVLNIMVDKNFKSLWPFYGVKFEDKMILDGVTWYNIKYDTTTPKKLIEFEFLPKFSTEAWVSESSFEFKAFGGFDITHKMTHGDQVVEEAHHDVDVKANNEDKFEMEVMQTGRVTEESPFYAWTKPLFGRYIKSFKRQTIIFLDKNNRNFYVIPQIHLKTEFIANGDKIEEFEFDNTVDERTLTFMWDHDKFSQSYNFELTWQFNPDLSGLKISTNLKRGYVSVYKYDIDADWYNGIDKIKLDMNEVVSQMENSPTYEWGHYLTGKFFKDARCTSKFVYDKQNINFLLGKFLYEVVLTLDDEEHTNIKIDTTNGPSRMLAYWKQPFTGEMFYSVRDLFGQDEITVTLDATPGNEIKILTDLPNIGGFEITTEELGRGSNGLKFRKHFSLNDREVVSFLYDPNDREIFSTLYLPNGQELNFKLLWLKQRGAMGWIKSEVSLSPEKEIEINLDWNGAVENNPNKNKIKMEFKGKHPLTGNFDITRHLMAEKLSFSEYKIQWTGDATFRNNLLEAYSPMSTDIEVTVDTESQEVSAKIDETLQGKRYAVILENGSFRLITGGVP